MFDLGAHHGVIALMLADLVAPDGQVIAVEANPDNVAAARENVRRNAADRSVTVIHGAVSDRDGALTFARRSNGRVAAPGSGGSTTTVPAFTIDALSARHGPPTVLCVDVEGYELHALRGARETLKRHTPDLFVEVHVGCGLEAAGGSVEELLATIPKGYHLYVSPKTEGGWGEVAMMPLKPPWPDATFLLVGLYPAGGGGSVEGHGQV